jgi:hypothetical protein
MLSAEPPRRLDLMTHRRCHRTNISLQLLKNRLCSLPPIPRPKPVSVPAADRTNSLYPTCYAGVYSTVFCWRSWCIM